MHRSVRWYNLGKILKGHIEEDEDINQNSRIGLDYVLDGFRFVRAGAVRPSAHVNVPEVERHGHEGDMESQFQGDHGESRLLRRDMVLDKHRGAVWNEMRRVPVKLELEHTGDEASVTIPSVGAWNGGYLTGV